MDNINEKFNKSKEIIYYLKKKTKLMKYIRPKQLYYSINIDNNNSNINLLNYFEYNNDTNIEWSNVKIIIKSNKNIYYNNNIYLNSNLNTVLYSEIFIINEQFKKEKFNYNIDISIIENEYYDYYKIDNNTYYKSDIFRLNINEEPLKKISIKNDNLIFENENESGINTIINNIKNYIEYNENLDLIIEIENSSIEKSNLSLIKIKENCNITLNNNNSNFNILNYLDLTLVDKDKDFDFNYISHSDYYKIESNNIIFNKNYTLFNYDITIKIIDNYYNLNSLSLNVKDNRFDLIYNNLNTFIISDNNKNLNIYNYLNFYTFRFTKDQIVFSNIEKKNYYDIIYNSNINFKKYYYEYEINLDLLLFDEINKLNLNIKDQRYEFALDSLNFDSNIYLNEINEEVNIYDRFDLSNLGLTNSLIIISNIYTDNTKYTINNSNLIFENYYYKYVISFDLHFVTERKEYSLNINDKRYELALESLDFDSNIYLENEKINIYDRFNLSDLGLTNDLVIINNIDSDTSKYIIDDSNLEFHTYYYNYVITFDLYFVTERKEYSLNIKDQRYLFALNSLNLNSNIILENENENEEVNIYDRFDLSNLGLTNSLVIISNIDSDNSKYTINNSNLIFENYYYKYVISFDLYFITESKEYSLNINDERYELALNSLNFDSNIYLNEINETINIYDRFDLSNLGLTNSLVIISNINSDNSNKYNIINNNNLYFHTYYYYHNISFDLLLFDESKNYNLNIYDNRYEFVLNSLNFNSNIILENETSIINLLNLFSNLNIEYNIPNNLISFCNILPELNENYYLNNSNLIFVNYYKYNYDINLSIYIENIYNKTYNLNITDIRYELITINYNNIEITDQNNINLLNVFSNLNIEYNIPNNLISFSNILPELNENYYLNNSNLIFENYYKYNYNITFDIIIDSYDNNRIDLYITDKRYNLIDINYNSNINITTEESIINLFNIFSNLTEILNIPNNLISFSNIELNEDYYEIIGNSNIKFNDNYKYNHNINLKINIENIFISKNINITDKRYELVDINYNSNINITTEKDIINLFNVFSNFNNEYNIPISLISFSNILPELNENYYLNNSNLIFVNYYKYNYNINLDIYIEYSYYNNYNLNIIDKRYELIPLLSYVLNTNDDNVINIYNDLKYKDFIKFDTNIIKFINIINIDNFLIEDFSTANIEHFVSFANISSVFVQSGTVKDVNLHSFKASGFNNNLFNFNSIDNKSLRYISKFRDPENKNNLFTINVDDDPENNTLFNEKFDVFYILGGLSIIKSDNLNLEYKFDTSSIGNKNYIGFNKNGDNIARDIYYNSGNNTNNDFTYYYNNNNKVINLQTEILNILYPNFLNKLEVFDLPMRWLMTKEIDISKFNKIEFDFIVGDENTNNNGGLFPISQDYTHTPLFTFLILNSNLNIINSNILFNSKYDDTNIRFFSWQKITYQFTNNDKEHGKYLMWFQAVDSLKFESFNYNKNKVIENSREPEYIYQSYYGLANINISKNENNYENIEYLTLNTQKLPHENYKEYLYNSNIILNLQYSYNLDLVLFTSNLNTNIEDTIILNITDKRYDLIDIINYNSNINITSDKDNINLLNIFSNLNIEYNIPINLIKFSNILPELNENYYLNNSNLIFESYYKYNYNINLNIYIENVYYYNFNLEITDKRYELIFENLEYNIKIQKLSYINTKDIYHYEFVNSNNEVYPDNRIINLYEKEYEYILNEKDELEHVRSTIFVLRTVINYYLITMEDLDYDLDNEDLKNYKFKYNNFEFFLKVNRTDSSSSKFDEQFTFYYLEYDSNINVNVNIDVNNNFSNYIEFNLDNLATESINFHSWQKTIHVGLSELPPDKVYFYDYSDNYNDKIRLYFNTENNENKIINLFNVFSNLIEILNIPTYLISFSNIELNENYYEIISNSNIKFNDNYKYNHNINLNINIENTSILKDINITDKRYNLIDIIKYNSNINITSEKSIINLLNIFSNLNIEYNIPINLIKFSNILPELNDYYYLNNSNLIFEDYLYFNYNINLKIYIENIYYNNFNLEVTDNRTDLST